MKGNSVSTPVDVEVSLLPWPGDRVRLGMIALSTDHSSECEIWAMAPQTEVEIFVSRIANENPTTVANLRAMAPRLKEAAQLILPGSPVGAMLYSCTSGSIVIGADEVASRINEAKPETKCTMPTVAAMAAFKALCVSKVAVLTPYLDEVNGPVFEYLTLNGISVVQFKSFRMASDVDMAMIPPSVVKSAAIEANVEEAEAIFISCTALRTSSIIHSLEKSLGKPVITSNQAMLWHGLRLAGYRTPISGFGVLLSDH